MQSLSPSPRKFPQPLDRVAIALMGVLAVLIAILWLSGSHSLSQVRDFTWQDKQIGAADQGFMLTFSRPMDQASVEKNLQIEPPLPGKISWAGRRMVYTLTSPAPYGMPFQVSLPKARDRFTSAPKSDTAQSSLKPFVGNFRSRDRIMAYIGTQAEETGRLVIYNLTHPKDPEVLTPKNLTVMDFQIYPQGDKILFSALDRSQGTPSVAEQKLYTVTTGIAINSPEDTATPLEGTSETNNQHPPGQVSLLLDNTDYQNLQFDLSADGQAIVVERINRKNMNDSGPWLLRRGEAPQPLKSAQQSGDFLITPDSASLAIAQGQGLALIPLQPNADPLDFLPKYGTVLGFASDGSAAAMVKFNTDYTRALVLVTNQGIEKEVLRTTGSILKAQFDPTHQILYCLLTNLLPGKTYQERPYLAALDLQAALKGEPAQKTLRPLMLLPMQQEIQMSLAPDGLALLFDQTRSDDRDQAAGKNIADSRLWLLPLVPGEKPEAKELRLPGLHPRWFP